MSHFDLKFALVVAIILAPLFLAAPFAPERRCAAHEGHEPPSRAVGAIQPRLSASGDDIACSYQGAIWRLRPSAGKLTRLTDGEGFDVEPAWSPDGKLIAYVNSRNFSAGALRIVRSADGEPVQLGAEITVLSKLSFDPSGRRLLAYFQITGQGSRLAWFDWAAGRIAPLEIKAGVDAPFSNWSYAAQPALSHDGQWIFVRSTLDLPDEQMGNNGPHCDLWKLPADGGTPQRIVRFPARIHDVCWRADDRALYVVTELGGVHNDLWEIPLDDPLAGARKLTFGQTDEDRPSASSDGRWLLYTENHRGPTALVLRDLAGEGSDERLSVREFDFRRPTGQLALQVLDEGQPAPAARVSIRHAGGKFHAPPGALYRLLNDDLHFYARGQVRCTLPEGHYQVKVARGPEYRVTRSEFDIGAGGQTEVALSLSRWTNQRADGWVAGENHIHANYGYGHWYNSPRTMLDQCQGEDLTVANFMVANSDGDGVYDREHFRGRPDPLSNDRTVLYWNEEFRSTIWGHMTLLNLKQLVTPIYTGFFDTTHPHDVPTNADIADHTHEQDGNVNYNQPAHSVQDPYLGAYTAKELPIDVALGKVDSIDVMGSNQEANMAVWYRLLNCGLRVPASAGTDCFLNRIASRLPGSDRAYVECGGEFSYDRWIDNLRAGKSFVTNGPMLRFSAAGRGLGETLHLNAPGPVRVEGRVDWQFPLQSIEVLLNGQVAAAPPLGSDPSDSGDPGHVRIDEQVQVERSGWLALRVRGGAESDQLRGLAFAHSGAIYVEVKDRPVQAREDAKYFLTWIDRLWEQVRKRNRIPAGRQVHVEEQIAAARAVYRKLAEPAD